MELVGIYSMNYVRISAFAKNIATIFFILRMDLVSVREALQADLLCITEELPVDLGRIIEDNEIY